MCKLDDNMLNGPNWDCKHVFKGTLKYELPEFHTVCTAKRRLLSTIDTNDVLYLEDGHFVSGQRTDDSISNILLKQDSSLIP